MLLGISPEHTWSFIVIYMVTFWHTHQNSIGKSEGPATIQCNCDLFVVPQASSFSIWRLSFCLRMPFLDGFQGKPKGKPHVLGGGGGGLPNNKTPRNAICLVALGLALLGLGFGSLPWPSEPRSLSRCSGVCSFNQKAELLEGV